MNETLFYLQPKLNERDIEREKLRKENQLLRDRLNSIHEREQFSNECVSIKISKKNSIETSTKIFVVFFSFTNQQEKPENGVSSQDPSN